MSNMYIASLVITLEQIVVSYNQMYSGFPSCYTCGSTRGEASSKFMVVHFQGDIYNLVEIHDESLSS